MQKVTKNHILASAGISTVAASGLLLAYRVADANNFETRVETIEVDFKQNVTPAAEEVSAQTDVATNDIQTQFLFLLGLTVVGMLGIGAVVRDIRRDKRS